MLRPAGARPASEESHLSIQRHAGEAATVTTSFNSLSANQKRQIITFLRSL